MLSLIQSELRMLVRNRLVAVCAILIPLGFGAFLIFSPPGGPADQAGGTIATLQILIMVAMGVYVTGTTTLAARRQTLMLKRLRSGAASDTTIIDRVIFASLSLAACPRECFARPARSFGWSA